MKRIYALLALFAVSVSLGAPANKTLNIPIYENTATSFVGRAFTVSGNNNKVLGITGGDWALVSPLFGTSPTITTSILTDSTTFAVFNTTATTVNAFGAATTLNVGTSAATVLNFGGAATAAQFRFLEPSGSGTNYTGFKAQAQAGNVTYTLPAADGTNGQFLKTNGTGTLSWGTASGGGGGLTGSEGGNGAADSGLAALFDAAGSLTATTELTVKNASTAAHAYLADDGTIGFHAVGETNPRELVFPTDVLENEAKEIATKDWVTANAAAFDATAVDTVTWSDGANASNIWTFNVSGTDPTLTAGNSNFIFGANSVDIGAAGVRLSQDGDGAITFLGLGDGNDEDLTINLDDTANEAVISSSTGITALNTGSIGIKASGATSELGPLQTADGKPLLNDLSVYAAGTAYTLTNTSAQVTFGTTSPIKVIDSAGTYLITVRCLVDYSAATVSAETATIKLRRTNNTAVDVTGATTTIDLPVATTLTHSYGSVTLPPVLYVTTVSDDSLSIFANVSATLGAGSIKISEASIVAVRIR